MGEAEGEEGESRPGALRALVIANGVGGLLVLLVLLAVAKGAEPHSLLLNLGFLWLVLQVPLLLYAAYRRVHDRSSIEAAIVLGTLYLAIPIYGVMALLLVPLALPSKAGSPPVLDAFRMAWRSYRERKQEGKLSFKRSMAFAPLPFLFAVGAVYAFMTAAAAANVAAVTLPAGVAVASATAPAGGRAGGEIAVPAIVGGSAMAAGASPLVVAVLLAILGAACVLSTLISYPKAIAGYTRVLTQFDTSLPGARGSPWKLALVLFGIDWAICSTFVLGPYLLVVGLSSLPGPEVVLLLLGHVLVVPLVALLGVLLAVRLHLREVIVLGEERPLQRTLRLVRERPGEVSRRAAVQLLLLAATVALGILILPVAGIPAAIAGGCLGLAHLAVYAIGYEGSLHYLCLMVEVFGLSFFTAWLVGLVLSPLTLAQGLYRLEYVRGLLGQVKLFVPKAASGG